jgi:hypothetical protein
VYKCKEVLDNTVTVIRNALSATPIDKDRLVVGTEEGLFTVDLDRDGEGKICLHPHFCALQGCGSFFFTNSDLAFCNTWFGSGPEGQIAENFAEKYVKFYFNHVSISNCFSLEK